MTNGALQPTCCVVGGGPAGIMLGYLLARAGVPVTVLEKHKDFLRDFRGDTVHPATLEILYELGLLEEFLKLPHQRISRVGGVFGDFPFEAADFRHLPTHCKFAVLMPQWDFLNFLSGEATKFPAFDLLMQHEAVDLIRDGDRIGGVLTHGPENTTVQISADLVIGCDGRHSTTRQAGRLELVDFGVPIDVLWFHIRREPDDPEQVLGRVNYGKALVLINRGSYFQAGLIIRKDSFDEIRQRGLEAFRSGIRQLAPWFDERADELRDWDQIKLLTVQINRLRRWYRPGLLCIGDAAHAMSPAGGVGINLAIQDAVAAANILAPRLREGRVTEDALAAVQNRREFPTRITQAAQVKIHNVFASVFENPGPIKAPWEMKAVLKIPGVHFALGYAVGIGVRPEHARIAKRQTAQRCTLSAIASGAIAAARAFFAALGRTQSRHPKTQPASI